MRGARRFGIAAAGAICIGLLAVPAAAAGTPPAAGTLPAPGAAGIPGTDSPPTSYPNFRLVESWPLETTLDHQDIPDAADVWLDLIRGAKANLDFAEFYLSDDPAGGGRLKPIIEAIEAAAGRGVQVRMLAENSFYKTYPRVLDRLARVKNITVRRLDSAAFKGGVLHAKYFLVDYHVTYLGSQNFDWRALEHIQELGVAIDDALFTTQMKRVFDLDWAIAGAIEPGRWAAGTAKPRVDSLVARSGGRKVMYESSYTSTSGDTLDFHPVMSPVGRLPLAELWDEPQIVEMIDGAKDSVQIQLLTYKPVGRGGGYYEVLENALKRAAARGVAVRLLVADWCKRKGTIEYLKSLSLFPGIEVRMMSLPPWSGGFIPFARVCHAKYMLADGARFWIGTSNWEKDYFHSSRNVGVIGSSRLIGAQLAEFFRGNWTSKYAELVKAEVEYTPPRVSE